MANVAYKPEWSKFEKDLSSDDPIKARKAAEAFDETRNHEMKNSKKAREWETSRKKAIAEQKPSWKKKQLQKKEDEKNKTINDLKKAGNHEKTIQPVAGYILVKPIEVKAKTESGIIVAGQQQIDNTGIVIKVGGTKLLSTGNEIVCPVKVDDEIMYKRGAGVSLTVKGESHKFMTFDDVLGVFHD